MLASSSVSPTSAAITATWHRHATLRSAIASILCCARLTVRELQAEDIPCAAALLSEVFAPPNGYNILQQRIVETETARGLASRLGKSTVFVAAQDDGELVGSIEAFTPAFLEGKAVRFWNASLPLDTYVSALAVKPSRRRAGVASALLAMVEARAWKADERVISLQVDASNAAALALYDRLGYVVVGQDSAVTMPSSNPLVSNLILGGAQERALLVLQKSRPMPKPPVTERPGRLARWISSGRSVLGRVSRLRMSASPPPSPPSPSLRPLKLLPVALRPHWRRMFGCEACGDSQAIPCPRCDGRGGYEAMGGTAVACTSCRSTGRVVCRACFVGDGYDIEAIRKKMGVPD